jgi:hypothetical protein
MRPIPKNNTGFAEWSVEPGRETGIQGDPSSVRYLHASGRVEIEIDPVEESYWNRDAEESKTRVVYPVNVYESTHYDYPHDEYVDHSLVATVRPGTSGQGYAMSFRMAQTLAINAILALESEAKWLSEPLSAPTHTFVTPSLDERDAVALYRELVVEHSGGMEPQAKSDALELTKEEDWNDLEEFIFSLDEDDFYWVLADGLAA